MVLLSIGDLHLTPDKANFKSSIKSFTKCLKEFVITEPSWTPNFICICGDIVDHGKVELFGDKDDSNAKGFAGEIIHEIMNAACINNESRVLMVPGNHDMMTTEIKETEEYEKEACNWLNGGCSDIPPKVEDAIAPYSAFRKKFLGNTASEIGSMNNLIEDGYITNSKGLPDGLNNTCGCRIFEKEKILFLELDSTLCDIPKSKRIIFFNKAYIDGLFHFVREYKQKGFYVVALFHHSLRHLNTLQYAEVESINIYDQIVEMADLCLTGHDHGCRSKEPDKLANKCQHILNSGFFSFNPSSQSFDSGATLIKIERYSELISILKLLREADDNWRASANCRIYSTASQYIDPALVNVDQRIQLPRYLSFKAPETTESLHEIIITRLFGPCDSQGPTSQSETGWSHYLIKKDGTERPVIFLETTGANIFPIPTMLTDIFNQNELTIVVSISQDDSATNQRLQNRLNDELRSYILKGKVVLIPLTYSI